MPSNLSENIVKKTKEEYEKGLKEGKWFEYPPRQDEKPDELRENDITEQLKRCEVCKQLMKALDNYKIISDIVEKLKKTKSKIIEEMAELSQTIGIKAEYFYPINDNLGELIDELEEEYGIE